MARARNVVDMVVAKLPPPGGKKGGAARARPAYDDKGGEADDGADMGYESAFNDLSKALKSGGDTKGGIAALKDFVEMCKHEEDHEEASEDESGDEES